MPCFRPKTRLTTDWRCFPLTQGEQDAKKLVHKSVAEKEASRIERVIAQELLDSANQAGDQIAIDYAESRVNLSKGAQLSNWDWKVINARNATFQNLFNESMYKSFNEGFHCTTDEMTAMLQKINEQYMLEMERDGCNVGKRLNDRFADCERAHSVLDPDAIVLTLTEYTPVTPADEKAGEVFSFTRKVIQVKNTISVRDDLVAYVNDLARQGNDPETGSALQAAAIMVYGYVTDGISNGTTIGEDELCKDLLECLDDYEQDIAERSASMHKLTGDDTHVDLNKYDAQFFTELENELFNYCRPEISFPYVIAYIKTISSGTTDDEATATAWNAWRNDMTWRGAKQYEAVLLLGGTKSAAWKAFWTECKTYVPRTKSKIVSASPAGLKIIPAPITFKALKPKKFDGVEIVYPVSEAVEIEAVTPREIGWGIAVNKMRNNEFDLSNKSKILGLKSKGWREAGYFLSLVAKA